MTATWWLLVGLGNPGPTYAMHRHNVGAMVGSAFLRAHAPEAAFQSKWKALTAVARVGDERVRVLLPQTYMNRSGSAVRAAAEFHRIPAERIVVVHDELDFPFGRVAVKKGGGHGGHNGLRDVMAHLGTGAFVRVRVGIGRPPAPGGDVAAWVLSDFSAEERTQLPEIVDRAQAAVEAILNRGPAAAMNEFNRT